MFKIFKNISKSLLLLIIAIIALPIIVLILVAILQSCNGRTSYSSYESKMIIAAKKYFNNKDIADGEIVSLNTLVNEGYIKSPKKLLRDSSCDGRVTVRPNGTTESENENKYIYYVYLKCDNYNTSTLLSYLMNDLTTSESGLYEDGNYYVYKGDMVNNYVKFYGNVYRVISIEKNGAVRLVKNSVESNSKMWDNKYNIEVGHSYGKNIYKDSSILKVLLNDYNNKRKIKSEARKHILAHDVCIGKRDSKDYSISYELDCSEILTNQVISLMNISDFGRASLDPDCNSIIDMSCRNYNYLSRIASNSWTLNTIINNTYQAYYFSSGIARLANLSEYKSYNIVIYIDGNEFVKEGNGSESKPYIIE